MLTPYQQKVREEIIEEMASILDAEADACFRSEEPENGQLILRMARLIRGAK